MTDLEVIALNDDDAPASENPLFDRNLAILGERFRGLDELIRSVRPIYSLTEIFDEEPDFELRNAAGTKFYEHGARRYALERVEAFKENPHLLQAVSQSVGGDRIGAFFEAALMREDADEAGDAREWRFAQTTRAEEAKAMVLVGCGLGHALDALLDAYDPAYVLLLIEDANFLALSAQCYDWEKLLERCDAEGVDLTIQVLESPDQLIPVIQTFLWAKAMYVADGTLAYFHHANQVNGNHWQNLQNNFASMLAGVGFFEDELHHFWNSYVNISSGEAEMFVSPESRSAKAVIVGSGPSLDGCFEAIRALADHAVIIAAGTAVEPLLAEGIVPDAMVLLERGDNLVGVYRDMAERVPLDRITMLGSTTLYPGVTEAFGRPVYFFRPGLNVNPGLCANKDQVLSGCDPTVSNTALAVARKLGAEEIYLFGVDFGSRFEGIHHAAQSAYYTGEVENTTRFQKAVPANFGGSARTDAIFDWSRFALQRLIMGMRPARIFNCSDGALIEGTTPLRPEAIRVPETPPESRADAVIRTEIYDAETATSLLDGPYGREATAALFNAMRSLVDHMHWEDRTAFNEEAHQVMWVSGVDNPLHMMVRGTFTLIAWRYMALMNRASDEMRGPLAERCRKGMERAITAMETWLNDSIHALREGRHRDGLADPNPLIPKVETDRGTDADA